MEGKIFHEFARVQRVHLLEAPMMLTVTDWQTAFITHLLQLTHGQWLYRNVSKHHQQYGQLKEVERASLLQEIAKYMHTPPAEIPEESRFPLEVDFTQLRSGRTNDQSYWVNAVKAAVVARRRSASLLGDGTRSPWFTLDFACYTFWRYRRRSSIYNAPQS